MKFPACWPNWRRIANWNPFISAETLTILKTSKCTLLSSGITAMPLSLFRNMQRTIQAMKDLILESVRPFSTHSESLHPRDSSSRIWSLSPLPIPNCERTPPSFSRLWPTTLLWRHSIFGERQGTNRNIRNECFFSLLVATWWVMQVPVS